MTDDCSLATTTSSRGHGKLDHYCYYHSSPCVFDKLLFAQASHSSDGLFFEEDPDHTNHHRDPVLFFLLAAHPEFCSSFSFSRK